MSDLGPEEINLRYHAQINRFLDIQKTIVDLHPLLKRLYPLALVDGDQFYIFDVTPGYREYRLAGIAPIPMPVPFGVRAAFPLEVYQNRMACVVTPDVFDSLVGYIAIFHEFVHCWQAEKGERKIKMALKIAQQAQADQDFMWEIHYPFPYHDPDFVKIYQAFLEAVERLSPKLILQSRHDLRQLLNHGDWEYLTWQEWKEGFARYMENRIRDYLNLNRNHDGHQKPFDRVSFYDGGAHLINYLCMEEPDLEQHIVKLFHRMFQ